MQPELEPAKPLEELFTQAVEALKDLDYINAKLAELAPDRPDLQINQPAQMIKIDWQGPGLDDLNNFGPNLMQTGGILYGRAGSAFTNNIDLVVLKDIAGRGLGSNEYARGKVEIDYRFFGITHISKACFVRMWLLFPDFTKRVATECQPPAKDQPTRLAYELMSMLIDQKDSLVTKEDGKVDNIYLTR